MYRGLSRITDVRWTPQVNMLIVTCGRCDSRFAHRAEWVTSKRLDLGRVSWASFCWG